MAQDSKRKRYLRRLKREISLTRKYLDIVVKQRDQARMIAIGLEEELKKRDDGPVEPAPEPVPTEPQRTGEEVV